ncbi:phage tail sheath family protein [Flavonifractor plautii]|jgi:phage tail sheath protein FI|uniref:Phage tail sheath family protein n=1 Tax=Flavonifractor plautii TaxID=292800 RepID=A0AAW6C2A9_FLAPL|nr:phage tail sheath family protein [Flavonifractor plautii]MDB7887445.1 phage tail sheath family protein [Flavonifractor plautii]MDB7905214.1 phage tail sheath family protein [Flavonifractor plautii]
MADYKHGTYGEFAASIGDVATQAGTIAVYVGLAPVNLVRGFEQYVNSPVKLSNFNAVKRYFGYSPDWSTFDLCEAFQLHFDNAAGNIGPIVAINVLDPAKHKKAQETTKELAFANGQATIQSGTIILDTLVLADKVEGVDFSIDYDFTKGQVIIDSLGEKLTGPVSATFSEVDISTITEDDIIGGVTAAGAYTGLGCVGLVYPELGLIPNLIACPGWSSKPKVYEAMVKAGTKVNGHWDAVVFADIPLEAAAAKVGEARVEDSRVGGQAVDTIEKAIKWKDENAYTNERSKVFWPKAMDTSGRIFHASTLGVWRQMLVDETHDGIPMESCSNKAIPVARQYFGTDATNRGFDQQRGNELNAQGITTLVYWGGLWVLWGPHTAAYKYGQVTDNRAIFDNSIRTMMHITNSFQQEHALTIDQPMTRAMADTIKNREQEKADALAAVGALIGTPVVEFTEEDNSTGDLVEGNFTWATKGTPTPPFKSGTMRVAYTTAGFDSYFGEVE